MISQVMQGTSNNPLNNDFVKVCQKYLQNLNINLSFQEIEDMSTWSFKKQVKEKIWIAAFKYLIKKKKKNK